MSCSVKINTIKHLEEEGVIEGARRVIDLTKFNELNNSLTNLAFTKWNVGNNKDKLFTTESKYIKLLDGNYKFIIRAIPNEQLFKMLQEAVDNNQINQILETKLNNNVNYTLKAVDILNSDKAVDIFNKGQKNNWSLDKILTELQVPKEQKQIILNSDFGGFYTEELSLRENIIMSLLADNSFAVEINTAKDEKYLSNPFIYYIPNTNGEYDILNVAGDLLETVKTSKEAENKVKELNKIPTQYYSNLTVPGGTNYTENEIATPAITPSIKGHAQFATDNGIGWFRSDDKADRIYNKEEEVKDENGNILVSGGYSYIKSNNKARRILEIQSDLFQKGRNLDILQKHDTNSIQSVEEADKIRKEKDNQFLQLLNKDNNWVTFFVKSIIQDTAKQTITEVQESDVEAKVKELEKDGLLEIDCKGKLKAEKGLQTNFTKGGKWKLIKDLKGYPTHKEGGVDLTIGKNGVSIKNGNTEFTAKHGLVIPKN